MEASRSYKSLKRGLQVMEAVVDLGGSATFSTIARKTGLPRSTAHHILGALVEFGYLIRDDDTGKYNISCKLFRLTGRTWSKEQLADMAMPFLIELSGRTGEGTSLGVLRDGVVTIIAKREPDTPLRVAQEVGATRPIYSSAVGKALAAWLPARELAAIIDHTVFEPYTNKTISSPAAFRRELTRIRASGFAFDNEEHYLGIRCLATLIRDHSGEVRASLCLVGPKSHFQKKRLPQLREVLAAVAADFSARLGHVSKEETGNQTPTERAHAGAWAVKSENQQKGGKQNTT